MDEYPRLSRRINERYRIQIEVRSTENLNRILAIRNVDIIVSHKNTLAPYFLRDNYTTEIFRFGKSGEHILQLEAKDDDEFDYNRDFVYSLASTTSNGYSAPAIGVGSKDGSVITQSGLRGAPDVISTFVTARNTGSPPLHNRTNVTIFVREISGKRCWILCSFYVR